MPLKSGIFVRISARDYIYPLKFSSIHTITLKPLLIIYGAMLYAALNTALSN